MNLMLRRTLPVGTLAFLALALAGAPAAEAHPLGNFTVNHHTGLTLRPDRIDAVIITDHAEIAAAQEQTLVDTDHDGDVTTSERRAHARTACAVLATQLRVAQRGVPVTWKSTDTRFQYLPGEAGLPTSRLTCTLTSPARLTKPAQLNVRTTYDTRRLGWHELTARGLGISLSRSDVPATSPTDELRSYPQDPLATPLDQRTATLHTQPGPSTTPGQASAPAPGTGWFSPLLDRISSTFNSAVGSRELTFSVGLLALLLSLVLGASHALMPGHGKTIMAAYLAGRRGTPRDALTVGATVTITHTAGVLLLGLALPLATTLAGETVLAWLGLASGLLVTGIGVWLLHSAVLRRPTHQHHHHHGHSHDGPGHTHHGHAHSHHPIPATPDTTIPQSRQPASRTRQKRSIAVLPPALAPSPFPSPRPSPPRQPHRHRAGTIGLGIAGGLVPSPSALVVLLGAVALGRTAFGVLLVIGYGLGMAATLTAAGLLLVRLRDRIKAHTRTTKPRWAGWRTLARLGPLATSTLVLIVGLGLIARSSFGPW
ncbi:nickel transporter [Streptomyces sp. NBC_01304]|nr:nickel transporter [Streptomyces sp. NBC_01304]